VIAWLEHDEQGCYGSWDWRPYERGDTFGVANCIVCGRLLEYGVTKEEAKELVNYDIGAAVDKQVLRLPLRDQLRRR